MSNRELVSYKVFTGIPLEYTGFTYKPSEVKLISKKALIPKVSMFEINWKEFPVITADLGEGAIGPLYSMAPKAFRRYLDYRGRNNREIRKIVPARNKGDEIPVYIHIADTIMDFIPDTEEPLEEYPKESRIKARRIKEYYGQRNTFVFIEEQRAPEGAKFIEDTVIKNFKKLKRSETGARTTVIVPARGEEVEVKCYELTKFQTERADWINNRYREVTAAEIVAGEGEKRRHAIAYISLTMGIE